MFRRYDDPLTLMDHMAGAGRLAWFALRAIDQIRRDESERVLWDTWLHKEFKRGFADFKAEAEEYAARQAAAERMRGSKGMQARVVARSKGILDKFNPIEMEVT